MKENKRRVTGLPREGMGARQGGGGKKKQQGMLEEANL